jgi:pimeloyl-ACP methyl ester carboxylesterase
LSTNYVFFHGFLGRPGDWSPVVSEMEKSMGPIQAMSVDLNIKTLSQISINEASQHFVRMQGEFLTDWVAVGYSMGGRFLAQTLAHWPHPPKKVVFVSANLNFNQKEVKARTEVDQHWAKRFLSESFYTVIGDWNNLPVFYGSEQEPERFEEEYDKRVLADQLVNWSPVAQAPVDISKFKTLFVSGDRDHKYVELVKQYPEEQVRIVKDSGHRVLFDQPFLLGKLIAEFLKD